MTNKIKIFFSKIGEFFDSSTRMLGDSLIPKKYRKVIQEHLRTAGIREVPYLTFGILYYFFIAFSFALSFYLIFLTSIFRNIPIFINIPISIILVPLFYYVFSRLGIFVYHLYVDVRVQSRVSKMEKLFPDFLSVLSINLRAGNNFALALENSVDSEFGHLSDEINLIVRRIKLGGGVEEAMRKFKESYRSDLINDAFELIILSWKKGGDTASLVERIHDNIKSERFLNDKIVASVTNYKIFLNLLAFGITPAMFAISFHLIDLIKSITSELSDVPNSSALPFSVNAVLFNRSEFVLFSVLSVIIISICIAFVINIVKGTGAKDAYKEMFFYAVGTFLSYQVFMWVFGIFFALFAV